MGQRVRHPPTAFRKNEQMYNINCKLSNSSLKNVNTRVPVMAPWLTNLTGNHEIEGLIPGLAQWVQDPALP